MGNESDNGLRIGNVGKGVGDVLGAVSGGLLFLDSSTEGIRRLVVAGNARTMAERALSAEVHEGNTYELHTAEAKKYDRLAMRSLGKTLLGSATFLLFTGDLISRIASNGRTPTQLLNDQRTDKAE